MSHLERLRQLRRDPAAEAAGPFPTPPLPAGLAPEIDPAGHTFSPAIKAQQKEVAAKFAEAPVLATKARLEFEARYSEGFTHWQAGAADAALEQFAAAYILAREMNYRAGEADALNMTGVCYKLSGDLERASGVFEGVAKLCASMRDAPGEAAALGNLGQALVAQRRLPEAESAHERSLDLARGATDANGELSALFHLGTLRLRSRRFADAEAALAPAQNIAKSLGDVAAEVGVLQRLAAARDARQQMEAAQQQQQQPVEAAAAQPEQQQQAPPPTTTAGAAAAPTSNASATSGASGTNNSSPSRPARSRFVVEPDPELSASLHQRRLAVEPPANVPPPPAPLPPLEPPPPSPLQLLQRADELTRSLEAGSPLRLQVLRQLRAQHARLSDDEAVKACERAIDALHLQPTPAAAARPSNANSNDKADGKGGVLV